jgi:hypothetical protein
MRERAWDVFFFSMAEGKVAAAWRKVDGTLLAVAQ